MAPAPARVTASYANCTAVWNSIGRPIRSGDPGFMSKFDRDGDGVGCERDAR
ncbi:excalibur calcium-binding domain protein [Corynebacterium simulans]|nr:excalibur calcium-binding domain protein [Corynebacterium simulans]